jgi:predicted methyltransferase
MRRLIAPWLAMVGILGGAAGALAQDPPIPASIAAAVAGKDRPAADIDRDAARRPAELLAFAGVVPSDKIADIMPGQGYFTRLFSAAVGPGGHVYAIVPTELAQAAPKTADAAKALAADPHFANVSALVEPSATLGAPEPLDLAWTSDNYHDLYGFFGAAQAARFDAAVFAMLKPGGVFIVIDHAAAAGADGASGKTLHRIDPAIVRAQVLAAGFTFVAESPVLRNPADGHETTVFSPAIRGHTDQFVLKFRKPAA